MSEEEEWRDVIGYEGIYQVSNMGRVRRVSGGPGARPGHTLNPNRDNNGYLLVNLCRNGRGTSLRIHSLVCQAFHGHPPDSSYEVNHKNGKRGDNRVSNLEWVTYSENLMHAYRVLNRKRIRVSKLTSDQVRQIRELWATGDYTQTGLGKLFGISQATVWEIINRRIWAHL